jgi:outer membrane immunogenic protein
MRKFALLFAALSFTGSAFAADMAVKAVPGPGPAPVSWSGFYAGAEAGGSWGDETAASSPNDPLAANLFNGAFGFTGQQPLVNSFSLRQSGAVGGFEAGYNWQPGSNWLVGLETDFNVTSLNGQASGTSLVQGPPAATFTQSINTQQSTDWYGTVRGRLGWLATPNLLLFGTGGFAYGRVVDSANYTFNGAPAVLPGTAFGFSFSCVSNAPCFTGASSAIRTGWTAGGGAEWRLSDDWSAKIEYQLVDLGTETVRVTAVAVAVPGNSPSSFNTVFRNDFQVVRVGLNRHF